VAGPLSRARSAAHSGHSSSAAAMSRRRRWHCWVEGRGGSEKQEKRGGENFKFGNSAILKAGPCENCEGFVGPNGGPT
jgi:hypothetical protein